MDNQPNQQFCSKLFFMNWQGLVPNIKIHFHTAQIVYFLLNTKKDKDAYLQGSRKYKMSRNQTFKIRNCLKQRVRNMRATSPFRQFQNLKSQLCLHFLYLSRLNSVLYVQKGLSYTRYCLRLIKTAGHTVQNMCKRKKKLDIVY